MSRRTMSSNRIKTRRKTKKNRSKAKQSENNADEKRVLSHNSFNESFDEKESAQSSTSQREIVDSLSSKSEFSFDFRRNSRLLSRSFKKNKQSIFNEDEFVDSFKKKTIDFWREWKRWFVIKRRRRFDF
jgi:hypothetical protein